ncbi:MAG: acyltransferase [Variovorax sp.]|nr:MAG: acyltransferase [Variovorax sp.]
MSHPVNNFDFWRISAAALVLVSHQFPLLGKSAPALMPGVTLGVVGVFIFFAVSGFLVTQSWLSDPHAVRFVQRRFLRIWPALFVVTLATALVMGPLVSELPVAEYFAKAETHRYFKVLLLNIRYELPGVFLSNPYPRAVNGSLWSIPVEVRWYWVTLFAGLLGLLRVRAAVLVSMLALAVYHFWIYGAESNPARNYGIEYGLFFVYGACLQLYRSAWENRSLLFALPLAAVAALFLVLGQPLVALWVCLPFAVIATGVASTPVLCRAGRFGDFSYGFYIYAFPIQQLAIWGTSASLSLPAYLALSAVFTTLLALLSWHLVEKPALRLKPSRTRLLYSPSAAA